MLGYFEFGGNFVGSWIVGVLLILLFGFERVIIVFGIKIDIYFLKLLVLMFYFLIDIS